MKISRKADGPQGFSLLEVTVSLGVLAVAIPLSLAGITGSTRSDAGSRMESMAASMVAAILVEWKEAASVEKPENEREIWALGFASTGESLGKVEAKDYRNGCRKNGMTYLARVESESVGESGPARKVRVSVEFPALARAEQRQCLEFFTRLP